DLVTLHPALLGEVIDHDLGPERVQVGAATGQWAGVIEHHPDLELLGLGVRVADRRGGRQREDDDDPEGEEGPYDGSAQRHERPPKRRRSGTERGARHYKLAGPCCQGPAGRSERPRLRRAVARTCPARRRRGSAPRGWSG